MSSLCRVKLKWIDGCCCEINEFNKISFVESWRFFCRKATNNFYSCWLRISADDNGDKNRDGENDTGSM